MNYETFDREIVDRLYEAEKQIGASKGLEYTQEGDRLDNFKRLSLELGISPQKVLWIYLKKHLDSISYYVRNGKLESESLESRIIDARVYLSLLLALEKEQEVTIAESESLSEMRFLTTDMAMKESELEYAKDKMALQIQKIIEEKRNETDIYMEHKSSKNADFPLFCVGCNSRFSPDDMVDIVHIIEHGGAEYNAYYHHEEIRSFDGHTIKESNIVETKKASEIFSGLNRHTKAKSLEKGRSNKAGKPLKEGYETLKDLLRNCKKPITAGEIYKMQSVYSKYSSLFCALKREVKRGVLQKVDGKYSYNGADSSNNDL